MSHFRFGTAALLLACVIVLGGGGLLVFFRSDPGPAVELMSENSERPGPTPERSEDPTHEFEHLIRVVAGMTSAEVSLVLPNREDDDRLFVPRTQAKALVEAQARELSGHLASMMRESSGMSLCAFSPDAVIRLRGGGAEVLVVTCFSCGVIELASANSLSGLLWAPLQMGDRRDALRELVRGVFPAFGGPGPNVEALEPRVLAGARGAETLRSAVTEQNRELRYCYELLLGRTTAMKGVVAVQATIAPDGEVKRVEVLPESMGDKPFKNCMEARIGRWRFAPSAGDESHVTFSWKFAP